MLVEGKGYFYKYSMWQAQSDSVQNKYRFPDSQIQL